MKSYGIVTCLKISLTRKISFTQENKNDCNRLRSNSTRFITDRFISKKGFWYYMFVWVQHSTRIIVGYRPLAVQAGQLNKDCASDAQKTK